MSQIFYTDTKGHEVIADWLRIGIAGAAIPGDEMIVDDTAPFDFDGITLIKTSTITTETLSINGTSVTVLARETDGAIDRTAMGDLRVDPGLYTGEYDIGAARDRLSLNQLTTPGSIQDAALTNGLTSGYFTRNIYNAANALIGTNANDGLWRLFGVDASGNAVATHLLGDPDLDASLHLPADFENPTTAELAGSIDSYAVYDARNRKIETVGARVNAIANSGIYAGLNRLVTQFTYDFAGRVIEEVQEGVGSDDHRFRRFTYDASGNLTQEEAGIRYRNVNVSDGILSTRSLTYDRLGRQISETDGNQHTRRMEYDRAGNLIAEIDAYGNRTEITHDAFGREIVVTDANMHSYKKVYDQRDRLITLTDAMNGSTRFSYDKNDNWIGTIDANYHQFKYEYDSLGRMVHSISTQNGQLVHERATYDAYGNLVAETDAEGRTRTHVYGGFSRLEQEIDEGNRATVYQYDRFRHVVGETDASSHKNISKQYDAEGHLLSVVDAALHVSTYYSYDIYGERKVELTFTPGNAHNRYLSYQYDSLGQMVRWADAASGLQLNYRYDAAGNQTRVYSDSLSVDHRYTYDDNDRVTVITQGNGNLLAYYEYDAVGNRTFFYDGGSDWFEYTYDANDRISNATHINPGSSPEIITWTYDAVGNIKRFNDVGKVTIYDYFENNRLHVTNNDGQVTTSTLDRSGRVTKTVLKNQDGKSFTFVHSYTADGRELSVRASGSGKVSGNSTSTYDANDKLVSLNLGQSGSQEHAESKAFVYNNEGQILYRFHDDGENDTRYNTSTEYIYANGHIVGETGNTTDGNTVTLLDQEPYRLAHTIGDDFPANLVVLYDVQEGDTLGSIALAQYGNPSLWYVIADANGLTGSEVLKAGTQLQIPNTLDTGRLTSDAFVVYKEGDIIGSTLPNLKAPPPPPPDKCKKITAIVLIVVIAIVVVVATVVTAGAAFAVIAPAGAGIAAIVGGLLVAAAIGAAIGFAGGVATQGVLIALDQQEEFDWNAVAAATVVGAFSGLGVGIAKGIQIGVFAARMANFAKVAIVAVEVGGEATRQVIVDGKVDNWAGLAIAGVGGILSARSAGLAATKYAKGLNVAADDLTLAKDISKANKSTKAFKLLGISDDEVRIAIKNNTYKAKIINGLKGQFDSPTVITKNITKLFGKYQQKAYRNGSWDPADWGQNGASTVGRTLSPDVPVYTPNRPAAIAAEALAVGAVGNLDRQSVLDVIQSRIGREVNPRIPFSPEEVIAQLLPQPAMLLEVN